MQDFKIPHLGDDDELDEIRKYISPFELQRGLKFSKNGIMKYVEDLMAENDPFSADKAIAQQWEQKLKNPNQFLHLKKNQADCPFMRSEMIFDKKFKMNKLANCIF